MSQVKLSNMIGRLLGNEHSPQKEMAEASREVLDRQINQVRDSSTKVIAQARREINHSEQIIAVAEQAIRSLKRVEKRQ